MSEKLSSNLDFEDIGKEKFEKNLIAECYDAAVREIEEEYRDKTLFEKRVMFDLVMNDKTKEYMEDEDFWEHRLLGPTKEGVKKELEYDFDFGMNCGGFALEVFACLFLKSDSIEEATANVLEQFPFVRVLDEEGLRDDEHRVIYRCNNHGGHHFVKVEEDGTIIEKDGSGPVKEFTEWPEALRDAPEIEFAVNREHEIEPRDEDGNRIYSFMI